MNSIRHSLKMLCAWLVTIGIYAFVFIVEIGAMLLVPLLVLLTLGVIGWALRYVCAPHTWPARLRVLVPAVLGSLLVLRLAWKLHKNRQARRRAP